MYTWEPIDNCGCKIEEIYENGEPVRGGQVLKKCECHEDVEDKELWETLLLEDQSKSFVLRILHGWEGVSFGLEEKELKDGNEIVKFKEGIKYNYCFEGTGKDRKLNVEIEGASLSDNDKKRIQDLLEKRFGDKIKNKVIL